jgi:hypothetical protein
MTTRAGLAGLLAGLSATMILVYPFAIAWPASSTYWIWIAVVAAAAITIGGGWLAGNWSGSVHPGRCVVLGGLAGGLAGVIVFCLLGAATAGLTGSVPLFEQATSDTIRQRLQIEVIATIVSLTQRTFLASFLGGIGLGSLGGWLACLHRDGQEDIFDKSAPQMALNAAITAVPAAVVAAALAATVFSRLADSIGSKTGEAISAKPILDMPLTVSLLLVLIAHFALTLVVPHEARKAEHRCGMDEVKMAAYVGIGAAPVLAFLLLLVGAKLLLNPLVIVALLASAVMSLKSLQTLFKLILPRRASFPVSQDGWEKIETKLFGTIADSHGPRLTTLCIGCGLVMILPLHVAVFSVLINLTSLTASAFAQSTPVEVARKLFLTQTLVSAGLAGVSIVALTAIYLFYLNLGRWFKRWHSLQLN